MQCAAVTFASERTVRVASARANLMPPEAVEHFALRLLARSTPRRRRRGGGLLLHPNVQPTPTMTRAGMRWQRNGGAVGNTVPVTCLEGQPRTTKTRRKERDDEMKSRKQSGRRFSCRCAGMCMSGACFSTSPVYFPAAEGERAFVANAHLAGPALSTPSKENTIGGEKE